MIYILLIILICLIYYKFKNKIRIKYKTFLEKGFKPDRGVFGIYCYCGKQGSGKTLSVISFLNDNKDKKIYANLKSIKGFKYTYINGFEELLKLRSEHDIIIFYDEIFTELTKYSKINTDVLDFLSQMRKRRIIFLTTAQEWGEIPLTFRRYCRYQINCRLIRLPLFQGIIFKNFMDAENMHWSNDDNDWVAPLIENSIEHTRLKIANMYDTYEQIGKYSSFRELDSHEKDELLKLDSELLFDSKIDKDFWGEEESTQSLTGLR